MRDDDASWAVSLFLQPQSSQSRRVFCFGGGYQQLTAWLYRALHMTSKTAAGSWEPSTGRGAGALEVPGPYFRWRRACSALGKHGTSTSPTSCRSASVSRGSLHVARRTEPGKVTARIKASTKQSALQLRLTEFKCASLPQRGSRAPRHARVGAAGGFRSPWSHILHPNLPVESSFSSPSPA